MDNKIINILFLGGAKRVSLAEKFIEAGNELGIKVNIFSYELHENTAIQFVGTVVKGLKWVDSNLYSHLKEVISKHEIHIVLPFLDPATLVASRLKELLPQTFIPVSDLSQCEIFFDKIKAQEWFISKGFPVPVDDGSFPKIAKPKNGSASKGLVILKNKEEENALAERDRYIIQKFIKGDEFTVDAFISKEGKVIAAIPRKRLEVLGGEVMKSVTINSPEMEALSVEILTATGLRGPVTLQFIQDEETLKNYVMEINPRFGGGVPLAIAAGANIPLMILNEYLGKEILPLTAWNKNLLMVRANREFYKNADNH